MWTLSGFADEIDPDLKTQCATLNDLGISHVEFRSAWDTNVLDLTDEQVDEAAAILAAHDLKVSSRSWGEVTRYWLTNRRLVYGAALRMRRSPSRLRMRSR